MSPRLDNPPSQKGILDQAASPDHRRYRRYDVSFPCRVKPQKSYLNAVLPELKFETLDVSRGGLFFLASINWEIGTPIEFELDLPAVAGGWLVKIQCQGTIARIVSQAGGRIGIGATIDHYEFAPSIAEVI